MAQKQTKAYLALPTPGEKALPSWLFPVVISALAFLLYANTLGHDYALDDSIVVSENSYTQQGFAGIGDIFTHESFVGYFGEDKGLVAGARYRPLSIATLAIEVGIFGKDHPGISHLINVLLFAATCLLLYSFGRRVLPSEGNWLAFLGGMLFAVHPIHTEAVANIKGRDEILALLFTMGGLVACWDWVSNRRMWLLPLALVSWLLAFLSKESPLPLVAVVPFVLLLHPNRKSVMDVLVPSALFLLAAGIYVGIRLAVIGGLRTTEATDLLNNSFRDATGLERIGTIFYCMAYYVRLLFVPYPLTHDYYPYQIPLVNPWHPMALLGIVLMLGMTVLAAWGIWKKKPLGWLLLFYLATISIVSNLVFNVGVFMAERFLFLPSVAFCLLLPLFIDWLRKKSRPAMLAVSGGMALLFAILTMVRNPAWADNPTLFLTDVWHSPHSAKARTAGAAENWKAAKQERNAMKRQQMLEEALEHINEAVRIYPEHTIAWDYRGHILMERQQYAEAYQSYEKAISLQPTAPQYIRNLAVAANIAKDYSQSASAFERYLQLQPRDANGWFDLGLVLENAKEFKRSVSAYEHCVMLQPGQSEALGKIGMIQGRYLNRPDSAVHYMERALQAGGKQEWIYNNLGIAYGMQQNYAQSVKVLEEGLKVYPNSREIIPSLIVTLNMMGDKARAAELQQRLSQPTP